MPKLESSFRDAENVFANAVKVCEGSERFRGVSADLRLLLALGDRLTLACAGRFDRTLEVAEVLADVAGLECDEAERRCFKRLLGPLEGWLKAILYFSDPEGHAQAAANRSRFNLFETFLRLGLLEQHELECGIEHWSGFTDRAKGYLLLAKEERNSIHDSVGNDLDIERALPTARVLTLLAALYSKRDALRRGLRGLVTRPLDLGHHELGVLRAVRDERARHLERFAGRETVLTQLNERVSDPAVGWVVVRGTPGMGKSAVAAAFTKQRSEEAQALGGARTAALEVAPWLTGSLLHIGKQSKSVTEATNLLLAQASSLLLERLPPIAIDGPREVIDFEARVASDSSARRDRVHGTVTSRVENEDEHCAGAIRRALEQLLIERGEALLVVDGLDEMSDSGDAHAWLPHDLPRGAFGVALSRATPSIARFVEKIASSSALDLHRLPLSEIAAMLGLDPEIAESFLNNVEEKTDGWPAGIVPVRRLLDERGGRWEAIEVPQRTEYLRNLAAEWRGQTRERLLDVLAAFEPCAPLSAEELQSWLHYKGESIRLPALLEYLEPVEEQLVGQAAGQRRLALGPFGDFLRATHFSARDWVSILTDVAGWLTADTTVQVWRTEAFYSVWALTSRPPLGTVDRPQLAESLLSLLERRGHVLQSYDPYDGFYAHLLDGFRLDDGVPAASETVLKLLRKVAESVPSARAELGVLLILGEQVPKDADEGLRLLRVALKTGISPDAIDGLMDRVHNWLDEHRPPEDGAGMLILRELGDAGNEHAKYYWIFHVLEDGKDDEARQETCDRWAKNTTGPALAGLAYAYQTGSEVGMREDHGEAARLLRASIDAAGGKLSGTDFELEWGAKALLDPMGPHIARSDEEGRRLQIQAGEALQEFFPWRVSRVWRWLLSEPVSEEDRELGLRFLRRAAEEDDNYRHELADRLIDGDGVPCDPAEGLLLLKQLAMKADIYKRALADRLLDGNGVPCDPVEGLLLLKQLALVNEAGVIFGPESVSTDKLNSLLQGFRQREVHRNRLALAERLIQGRGVPQDEAEGYRLLRSLPPELVAGAGLDLPS